MISKSDITLVRNAAIAAVSARDGVATATLGLKDAILQAVGVPTAKGAKVWRASIAALRLAVCGKLVGIQALKDSAGAKAPANRTQDERKALIYNVINATAGRMMADLMNGKGPGKRKPGRKAGSVASVKVVGTARQVIAKMSASPKALGATLKLIVASLQANEGKGFPRIPELVASLQVTIGLL